MLVLLVMFGIYKLCSAVGFYMRVYAPTNIALDYFRSRCGLKWALPASLVLTPAYWGAGYALTTLIENGGPGWLNLLAALLAWNGLKFAILGAWSPVLLAKAVLSEKADADRSHRAQSLTAKAGRVRSAVARTGLIRSTDPSRRTPPIGSAM
jgi:hypothetical protein